MEIQEASDKDPEIWPIWMAAHAHLRDHKPDSVEVPFSHEMAHFSHVMRIWHFSSSVNSFFKRACAAI